MNKILGKEGLAHKAEMEWEARGTPEHIETSATTTLQEDLSTKLRIVLKLGHGFALSSLLTNPRRPIRLAFV